MKSILNRSSIVAILAGLSFAMSGCAQWGQERQQEGVEQQQEDTRMSQERESQSEGMMGTSERSHEREHAASMDGDKTVKKAQEKLQEQGYLEDSQVDGIFGQRTEQAIRKFQEEEGISVTGQLDNETLTALDIDPTEVERRPAGVEQGSPEGMESEQQGQEGEEEGIFNW